MKTVIVGDIGGQLDVFKDVVASSGGDPESCILPLDTTMIQVGDVVRFSDSPELDSLACALYAQKLYDNNPGRYIQLLGNHETPLLGGHFNYGWVVPDLPDARPIVESWWSEKIARIGVVLRKPGQRDILVTHAGLTRGYMQQLGTTTAVETIHALNGLVGNVSVKSIENPGGLVTGFVNPSADVFWALLGCEVHESWNQNGDHPDFNQIHGHSTLVKWATGEYFDDVPETVRNATAVNYRDRYSVTTYDSGYTLRTVDWVLLNSYRRQEWPLLILNGYEIIQ